MVAGTELAILAVSVTSSNKSVRNGYIVIYMTEDWNKVGTTELAILAVSVTSSNKSVRNGYIVIYMTEGWNKVGTIGIWH